MGTRLGSQRLWFGLLLTALAASPLQAAQIVFVDDLGDCEGNTPCFTTIQQGVNNASAPMDEQAQVRVFPGTYNESVNLFLIGSAVGGIQVDLLIINTDIFEIFGGPATSPAVSNNSPPWLPAGVAAQMEEARQRLPQSIGGATALPAAEGAAAGVALLPVTINAPAGPAIYGSNLDVDIIMTGLTVHSPNDDGVDIISGGRLEFNLGTANGNAVSGVMLESVGNGVGAVLSTFNDNGGAGAVLTAGDGTVSMFNCIADRNMLNGFTLTASSSVQVFSFPIVDDPLFAGVPPGIAARQNMGNGISAISATEAVTVIDFQALSGALFTPTIILDDNKLNGLVANGDEGVTAVGVQANGNDGSGLRLASALTVTLVSVIANDNQSQGVEITASDAMVLVGVVAKGNVNGIAAASNGTADFDGLFPAFGAVLIATTTDMNMLNGIVLTATGGPIFIFGPTAIANSVVGIQLRPQAGSQSRVTGGIICGNTFGLVLDTNAQVNAEGNWWGSFTGPFHATKNPGGLGNQVADGTSGAGMGDVDFSPWIDTVTASATGPLNFGSTTPINFQFSGGNGTVFLGVPPDVPFLQFIGGATNLGPGSQPPFTVSSPDGIITSAVASGPSVPAFVSLPEGIVQVDFTPLKIGPVTALITGPCGLAAALEANAGGSQAAPTLSVLGLFLSLAGLLIVAARTMRRA